MVVVGLNGSKMTDYDEVDKIVVNNHLELVSKFYSHFSKEEMLQYIKDNIGRVSCIPIYYCGNTISSIRIIENKNGHKMVSYWNVVDEL